MEKPTRPAIAGHAPPKQSDDVTISEEELQKWWRMVKDALNPGGSAQWNSPDVWARIVEKLILALDDADDRAYAWKKLYDARLQMDEAARLGY